MAENSDFSKNLNLLRNKKGWSQKQLADFATVSLMTIFRAESKGVIPRGENIAKIATALGVTESDLFKDPMAESLESPSSSLEAIGLLIREATTLTDSQLEMVIGFIEDLKKHDIEQEVAKVSKRPKSS